MEQQVTLWFIPKTLTLRDPLPGEGDLSRWHCPAGLKMADTWSSLRSVQRQDITVSFYKTCYHRHLR